MIESGENPPKIIECAAPIHVHAEHRHGSSSIIGM